MMKKIFLFFLLIFITSCTKDFSKPQYTKRIFKSSHVWSRRKVSIAKTGSFQNPLIKREARRDMLRPKQYNFDSW